MEAIVCLEFSGCNCASMAQTWMENAFLNLLQAGM